MHFPGLFGRSHGTGGYFPDTFRDFPRAFVDVGDLFNVFQRRDTHVLNAGDGFPIFFDRFPMSFAVFVRSP